MTTKRACKDCRWSEYNNIGKYTCRINPPMPLLLVGLVSQEATASWPMVDRDDWCGEFEVRELTCPPCQYPDVCSPGRNCQLVYETKMHGR